VRVGSRKFKNEKIGFWCLKLRNNYLKDKTKETLKNKLVNQKGKNVGGSWENNYKKSNVN